MIERCLYMAFNGSVQAFDSLIGVVTVADNIHFEAMGDPAPILGAIIRHHLQAQFLIHLVSQSCSHVCSKTLIPNPFFVNNTKNKPLQSFTISCSVYPVI